MISTYLSELVHRFRSQGQMNQALVINRSDFEKLQTELNEMHCVRALRALSQSHPSYYGLPIAIQENWVL
ncbi:MAG: hypothetical protein V7752_01675 [Halopseudomonas sp.]